MLGTELDLESAACTPSVGAQADASNHGLNLAARLLAARLLAARLLAARLLALSNTPTHTHPNTHPPKHTSTHPRLASTASIQLNFDCLEVV